MLGSTTDAVEIATFVNTTGHQGIPKAAPAIEQILEDMVVAGLVERRSKKSSLGLYGDYSLTEEGWARARELQAADSSPPDD